MAYSSGQIATILLKADKTMYKIGDVAYDNMFSELDEAYDYERDIIFIYKKAVEYGDNYFVGTLKLDQIIERLAAKLNIYDYGILSPIYVDVYTQVDQGLNIIYVLKTTALDLGPGLTGDTDFSQSQIDIDLDYAYLNTVYVIDERSLTINGVTYDLSSNRSWSVNLQSITTQGATTTDKITVGGVGLTGMTAGSGALYYNAGSNRVTVANYNAGGSVYVEVNGGSYSAVFGPDLSFTSYGTIAGVFNNATVDTDRFLVSDGGVIKYRTGAQLLSDIGGQPSGNYVPYVGATQNVDLGEYEIKAGQFTLDVSPTGTATVGTTRWNNDIGSSETTLKGGTVILKNGVDLVARVVNKVTPNTTLTKAAYQAVRVTGAQGQRLAVAYAQANNDNNSADTIGLVTETIPTNQEGFIITVGQLEEINTTGSLQGETWSDGDVLYLSPTTPGALTNVKPVAPQHLVVIGYVEYAHAIHGKIYVKVMNGWELGELHDVNTTGAVAGNVLKYNGTIWAPSSDIDTGITSLNGLTALSQTFATGTSGTDFNISSSTSTHTFNLPTASATNRGALSSSDWTTFNAKQNAITLTTTGSSGSATFISNTLNIPTYTLSGLGGVPTSRTLTINGTSYDLSVDRSWSVGTITSLTGEATASGSGAVAVTLTNSAVIGKVLTGLNLTGGGTISSTDTILQAFGKVQNQISALVGSVQYEGVWNASTNTPTIVSGTGSKGDYYVVNVAGSTNIDGITDWKVGDWIIFNGTTWDKVDNTDAVSSVNGFTGAVSLSTSNIAEGTNLYFTNLRAQNAITLTTSGTSGAATYTSGTLNIPAYSLSGLGGVPTSRTLTINGTAFDLSADRSYSVGTVTSVDLSVPTGFAISGNPITSSGTLALSFAAGYSLPTTSSQANWDAAYNDKINSASVTGTTTKTLTLTQQDGGTITASWTDDNTDAVTSVFGRTGAVVAQSGDYTTTQVTEGTNLYYTEARVSANTDVAANTAARHNAVTLGTANGLSLSTQQLSLALASGSTTGALSSTDWTTFNNKENAITAGTTLQYYRGDKTFQTLNTSVVPESGNLYYTDTRSRAALSFVAGSGAYNSTTGVITIPTNTNQLTNGAAFITLGSLSASAPLSYNNGTGAFTISQANSITNGFLSSTDWNTFNNKQNALTNPVTGTGTTNYVTKWTSSSAVGNSQIFDNGTNIGIGTASPVVRLQVNAASTEVAQAFSIADTRYLQFYTDGSISAINSYNSSPLVFSTSTGTSFSERMRITSGGNVGIGSTSPTSAISGSAKVLAIVDNTTANLSSVRVYGGSSTTSLELYGGGSQVGLYGSTAHPMVFSTNSTEAMRITSAGNVGIGTTSPAYKLQVSGGSSNNNNTANVIVVDGAEHSRLKINTPTVGGYQASLILSSGEALSATTNEVSISTSGSKEIRFATSGSERMRLDASGNVGIGTTSPTSLLHVYSGTTATQTIANFAAANYGSSSSRTYIQIGTQYGDGSSRIGSVNTTGNQSALIFQTQSATSGVWNDAMYINGSGNVGIGTTSPGARLHASGGHIRLDDAFSYQWGAATTAINGSSASNFISLYTNNSERLRLDASGNLGLGVTPSAWGTSGTVATALQVNNVSFASTDSNGMQLSSNAYWDGTSWRYIASSVSATNYFQGGGAHGWRTAASGTAGNAISFTQAMTLDASGRLGIGTTSPTTTLDVNGKIRATDDVILAQTNPRIDFDGGVTGALRFLSTSTGNVRMVIQSGGNIGIGTTSPQSRLDLSPPASQSTVSTLGYSANAQLNIRIPNSVGDVGQIVFTNDAAPTAGYASIGVVMTSGAGVGLGDIIMSTKSVGGDAVSSERLRITSAGYVGIGTTSPSQKLEVAGVIRGEAVNVYGSTDPASTSPYLFSPSLGALGFGGNGSERMRITSGGNVLIGTATNTFNAKLLVNGTTELQSYTGIGVNADASAMLYVKGSGTTSTNFSAVFQNSNNDNLMKIHNNGKINMGFLPTSSAGLSAGDLWNDGGTLKIV